MLNIDSIENGIVIDHITAGRGMRVYELLELDQLDTCVAIIKNARSSKFGRKDIIKIEGMTDIDLDVLGFIDDHATVCGGKAGGKETPSAAPKAGEHRQLQKPPVHYQRGGCGPGVSSLRWRGAPLPLPVLRTGAGRVRAAF